MSDFLFAFGKQLLSSNWFIWSLGLASLLGIIVLGIRLFYAPCIRKKDIKKTENPEVCSLDSEKAWWLGTIPESRYRLALYGGIGIVLLVSLLFRSLFLTVVLLIFLLFLWSTLQRRYIQKQRMKAIEQIPVFLQGAAGALQAGYSFSQSVGFVAQEIPYPLRFFLLRIHRDTELDIPLARSLGYIRETLNHPDVDFLVTSTLLQNETGGNLIQLFKTLQVSIRERIKLERDQRSFTSQGKLSAVIVLLLWPLSLFFFALFSPQQTDILFDTIQGNVVLGISLFLECVGVFWMSRILRFNTNL